MDDAVAEATAGGATVQALSGNEWAQIEVVSHSVRIVASVMQSEAPCLAADRDPDPLSALPFNLEAWNSLTCIANVSGLSKAAGAPNIPKTQKGKKNSQTSGRAATIAKIEEKIQADDRVKISLAATSETCPRVETFGKRTEAFAAALCAWARALKADKFDVFISCNRASAMLKKRCGEAASPAIDELLSLSHRASLKAGGIESLLNLAVMSPEFLVRPSFSGPMDIQIYKEQREAARHIARTLVNESRSLLLRYVTPPSGGKSSAAALFGAVAASAGEVAASTSSSSTFKKSFVVIYACFSNAVRVEVSRTVLAASVPFAVVTSGLANPSFRCYHNKNSARKNGKLKAPPPATLDERVVYSKLLMSKCDKKPVVLVCDLESASAFLKQGCGDVLLLDELTVGAEDGKEPSAVAKLYAGVLKQAPRCTVLMSATVPSFSQFPFLCNHFSSKFTNPSFETAASDRLSIGVEALDAKLNHWLPHHVTGGHDAQAIFGDLHLRRFYSPRGLQRLIADIKESGVGVDGLLEFDDLISHDAIRNASERLMTLHGGNLHALQEQPVAGDHATLISKITTSDASMYPGTSLIVSTEGCVPYFKQAIPPLMSGIPLMKRLMAKEKKKSKEPARSRKVDSDDEPMELESDEHSQMIIEWPSEALINSRAHLSLHAPERLTTFHKKDYRTQITLSDEIVTTSAERLVECLLSGAVLLDSPWSDRAFELSALALCDLAIPSHIVADLAICYGVNLPLTRVITLLRADEIGSEQMRQLTGRVGRTGKASKGEVVITDAQLLIASMTPFSSDALGRAPLDILMENL
jgi:hypothetical protein